VSKSPRGHADYIGAKTRGLGMLSILTEHRGLIFPVLGGNDAVADILAE
jgi:hypothetical protein